MLISYHYFHTLSILYIKALKNRLSLRKGHHYQPFLIAGLPRSGTTLLHTYLNTHPRLLSQGEIHLKALQNPDKIFIPYSQHIQAAGAKLLLPYRSEKLNTPLLEQLLDSTPEIKIIFLQRQNMLRWYISLQIACKTGHWSQTKNRPGGSLHNRQVYINADLLLSQLQEAEDSLTTYRSIFKNFSTLEISYEHLAQVPQQLLPEIQQFLGLRPSPLFSLLQKQNPEALSGLILNFEEISQALKKTPYAQQLNE